MTAPQIQRYIDFLSHDTFGNTTPIYDEVTCQNIDQIFAVLARLEHNRMDGYDLWLKIPRGTIEDYGDYQEWLEVGDVENYAEFEAMWRSDYPDEFVWYNFTAIENKDIGCRLIFLGQKLVLEIDPRKEQGDATDLAEFSGWLRIAVEEAVQQVAAGIYNDLVERELPPQHRTGTIQRAQIWEVWPESKAQFFGGITPNDITGFLAVGTDKLPLSTPRLTSVSASDFFRFCAMGYAANHYSDADKPPLEQYRRHADGRDDGLREINQDSPEAFDDWYHNRERRGGHPWEIFRGGNSSHISLYVMEDEQGYYLQLAGSAWTRTIETVIFFLALHRAGLPVTILDVDILKERLTGTEKIGVVPEGIFPDYCQSLFQSEKIIAFMNLPYENREEFAKRCVWQPVAPVRLKDCAETSGEVKFFESSCTECPN